MVTLKPDGTLYRHGPRDNPCQGSGHLPKEAGLPELPDNLSAAEAAELAEAEEEVKEAQRAARQAAEEVADFSPPELTRHVLSEIIDVLRKYVAWPNDESMWAVALWIMHTYVTPAFDISGRLAILSRQPASGKTRVLELVQKMSVNPMSAVAITPSVLWRKIEASSPPPTILLDEADGYWGRGGSSSAHRQLIAIINVGFQRNATVPRAVGQQDVVDFSVYAPVALAGLGNLPDTVMTRAVVIPMARRKKGVKIAPLREKSSRKEMAKIRALLELWADKAFPALEIADPDMPVEDRDADVWEALIAIADLASLDEAGNPSAPSAVSGAASKPWAEMAREACIKLVELARGRVADPTIRLLADVQLVFGEAENMLTKALLDALYRLPNAGWDVNTLNSRTLARILRTYGAEPKDIRVDGDTARRWQIKGGVGKGYKREDLESAFARYLDEITPEYGSIEPEGPEDLAA
jgi:type II secretory pathway pseudopilin PulG